MQRTIWKNWKNKCIQKEVVEWDGTNGNRFRPIFWWNIQVVKEKRNLKLFEKSCWHLGSRVIVYTSRRWERQRKTPEIEKIWKKCLTAAYRSGKISELRNERPSQNAVKHHRMSRPETTKGTIFDNWIVYSNPWKFQRIFKRTKPSEAIRNSKQGID